MLCLSYFPWTASYYCTGMAAAVAVATHLETPDTCHASITWYVLALS